MSTSVRAAAVVLTLSLALGGCTAAPGEPLAAATTTDPVEALVQLLGSSVPGVGDALRAGEDDLLTVVERVPADAVTTLTAAIDSSDPAGPTRAAGAGIPGVHTPIVAIDEPLSSSSQRNGMDIAVTGRTTLVVDDQTASYSASVARTGSTGGTQVLSDERTTQIDVPACIPDAADGWDGEVRHERVIDAPDGDTRVRLATTMRATAHRGGDRGPIALTDLRIDVTRTVTAADGSTTTDRGAITGSVPGVTLDSDPDGETTAGLRVTGGSEWLAGESGNLFLSSVVALVPEMGAAITAAAGAQDRAGVCVRVIADARGVTTLSPGESTPVDGKVVDTRTGEPVEATISAYGDNGEPDSREFAAPGTTRFSADGDAPPSSLEFTTSTPRGGDATVVRFGDGWAFEGVVFTITVDDVSASQTWSGFVCGDPLVDPWTFTQTADGMGDVVTTMVPFALNARPDEWGQVPMIEPLTGTASDEPPFRLYIDDVEPPEVTPREQRIEATVKPAGDSYCG